MTNEERIALLEEQVAAQKRHLVEQDKVMMEMHTMLTRLTKELIALKERDDGNLSPSDERPPHY